MLSSLRQFHDIFITFAIEAGDITDIDFLPRLLLDFSVVLPLFSFIDDSLSR